eukprot:6477055-Amphidinium_carterae.2
MPRCKRSLQDEIDICNTRATQAAEKAETKKVNLALRLFPGVSRPLWEKLQSLGYTDERIKQAEREAAQADKEAKSKKSLKPELAVGISDPIPERVLHLEEFDNRTLRDTILPHLEPASLSGANLRAVEKKSGGKASLLKMLTFLVGLDPDYRVCGHLRSWQALLAALKERSEARGRRGREMVLPVDWNAQGLYGIEQGCQEGVRIQHRGTEVSRTIPWEEVPACGSYEELTIVQNWSESKAALARLEFGQGDGIQQVLLAPYFPSQVIDLELVTPPAKLRKGAGAQSVKPEHPLQRSFSAELALKQERIVAAAENTDEVPADSMHSGDTCLQPVLKPEVDPDAEREMKMESDLADLDEFLLACPPPEERLCSIRLRLRFQLAALSACWNLSDGIALDVASFGTFDFRCFKRGSRLLNLDGLTLANGSDLSTHQLSAWGLAVVSTTVGSAREHPWHSAHWQLERSNRCFTDRKGMV